MSLLASLVLASMLGPGSTGLRPVPTPSPPPPWRVFPAAEAPAVDARSWIVYSVDHEAVVGEKNPGMTIPIASITKVMTAILTVEQGDLDRTVTVSAVAGGTPIGYVGQEDVRVGETWVLYDVLSLAMVGSGNRASSVLAEAVSGSLADFATLMNTTAARWGMSGTTFRNAHGLDAEGHVSTARDLVLLGRAALEHPLVVHLARVKHVAYTGHGRTMEVTSTNRSLGTYPGFLGIKTGDTANAGQTLLAYAVTQHDRFIVVVLGSGDRRKAAQELVAWASTTLGPRDRFFGSAVDTELESRFSEADRKRLAAAQALALEPGNAGPRDRTPLTDDLKNRFRDLLPELLGGDP